MAAATLVALMAFLVIGVASGPVRWAQLFTSAVWDPSREAFGATAMIWGTAAVAVIALALATPVAWGAAIALNEMAPRLGRRALRSAIELLAVIPSIVYGLLGIVFVRPFVSRFVHVPGGDSLLAAGLVLAVMVLPTIAALSVDALAAVPDTVREAAAACGLTPTEVIRSAVIPQARRGMRAAVLLGLARALGETVAVFLVVGRADGRLPRSIPQALKMLTQPGQTLTTKLNGPESVLAGTSGPHWAALCALGLILLVAVAALTVVGQGRRGAARHRSPRRRDTALRGAVRARRVHDGVTRTILCLVVVLPLACLAGVALVVVTRGDAAVNPAFWWSAASGSGGGGIRGQLAGTILLVAVAGLMAAPVGLAVGLAIAEYVRPRTARWLRSLTLTLGGVPSILLGLWGYWLFAIRLGWGKSWLTGALVLAIVAIPPVVIAVAAAVDSTPAARRETALAVGLRRNQLTRSVLVPQAVPGLVTGLLLGLARAAGETAPLLFTATVFSGAPTLPTGIRESPVASLPTHIFVLVQDSVDPSALHAAWGAALALIIVAGLLVLAAVPARRWQERVAP
jgi:phosphate transport system permease protein